MAKILSAPNFTRIGILLAVAVFLYSSCTVFGISCSSFTAIQYSTLSFIPKMVIIAFLFVFFKLITSFIKIIINRKDGKKGNVFSVLLLARYGLWVVFTLISATILFGDIGSIITSLGLIGFGVTFALQKPILNFVGWLNVNVHKPFAVGDRIRIGSIKGDVVEVQMMHTIIKGLLADDVAGGKIFSVPNELILTEPVENYTKESNFVKNEIKIGVTYESDWKKAKKILETIVTDITKKNLYRHKINLTKRISLIDSTIEKLSTRISKAQTKEREEKISDQIAALEEQKKTLSATAEDIPQQFRPSIHLDLADSAITLSAQFVAPYDMIRSVKSEINGAFLDAVRRDKTIEIAYPHLQVVPKKNGNGFADKNLAEFLQIKSIDLEQKV